MPGYRKTTTVPGPTREHLTALGEILELADEVHRAVDISGAATALLAAHGKGPVHGAGRTANRMSGTYLGRPRPTPAMPTPSPRLPAIAGTSPPWTCWPN